MTQDGIEVFRGRALKGANAFWSLAKATMPPEKRSILLAMERVSAPRPVARRAAQSPDRIPAVAAKAPRHMRTASLRWPPLAPRVAGGLRAVSARPFRSYDLDEVYW